ncbi:hypothetical protein [Methylobacterium hispanicum]|uniref:hypothetical protein n=1 Tax=Methylobacterium hispanicum TaxID=270350 RepID=UPI001EE034D0|nr:hypothetical protein [Methylobacterium hispanicum]
MPTVAEADPCRRALTPVEEAKLFARDALRAARGVLAGNPADAAGEAYLAVFAMLAVGALFPELAEDAGRACGASREA